MVPLQDPFGSDVCGSCFLDLLGEGVSCVAGSCFLFFFFDSWVVRGRLFGWSGMFELWKRMNVAKLFLIVLKGSVLVVLIFRGCHEFEKL